MVTLANGTAERRASERMLKTRAREAGHRVTAGEDKAYDTADHVANLRHATPHVTQNNGVTKAGKSRRPWFSGAQVSGQPAMKSASRFSAVAPRR
jgi:hypothetical protein